MYITWKKLFSVNIKAIDEQHKKLINMINDLHDAMKVGKGKNILGDLLGKMISYAQEHFSKEEEYLVNYNYPDYKNHKSEHKEFVEKVLTFQRDFENNKLALSLEVMDFLKNWLTDHILETDKKYVSFLKEQGVK